MAPRPCDRPTRLPCRLGRRAPRAFCMNRPKTTCMTLSHNTRGSLLMTLSMAGFAMNDGFMKLAFETMPVAQSVLVRGVFATGCLALLAWHSGALAFRPTREEAGPIAWRILGEIGATASFLTALSYMKIADASAVLQGAPLMVTMAAALLLGETVGWRRWSAISVGFVGMLLIVRPFTEGFDSYSLYAVMAVFFIVLRDIVTRSMSPRTPTLFVSTLSAIAITLVFALVVPFEGWAPMTYSTLAIYGAAAGFVIVAYVSNVASMRVGEMSAVAPFRYTVIVFALLVGLVFFGEIPDALTLAGAAIVVGAGLYTLWREQVVGRPRAAAAAQQRPFAPKPGPG